jgi:hypothetical protein
MRVEKINLNEFKNLISEIIKEEKDNIVIEYLNHNIEEDFPLFNKIFKSKSPDEKKEMVLKSIMSHPIRKNVYTNLLNKNEKDKAEKYINFIMKNPETKYFTWSEKINNWIPTGKLKVASGEGTTGK